MSKPTLASRCKRWRKKRNLEDGLALIYALEDLRVLIRAHCYNEASWIEVWKAVHQMHEPLQALKDVLSDRWKELSRDE